MIFLLSFLIRNYCCMSVFTMFLQVFRSGYYCKEFQHFCFSAVNCATILIRTQNDIQAANKLVTYRYSIQCLRIYVRLTNNALRERMKYNLQNKNNDNAQTDFIKRLAAQVMISEIKKQLDRNLDRYFPSPKRSGSMYFRYILHQN